MLCDSVGPDAGGPPHGRPSQGDSADYTPPTGPFHAERDADFDRGQKRCQERRQDAFSSYRENIRCYRFVAHLGRSLSSAFRARLFGRKIYARDRT
jgi:hypothetical protein